MPAGNPKWVKGGASPNPGGRPREHVAKLIDRIASPGAEAEIRVIAMAAKGIMEDPHEPGGFVRVSAKLRLEAAQWIAERRHGKAPASVEIDVSGHVDHRHGVDLTALDHGELGTLERILEKAAVDALAEGEIVDSEVPAKALTDSQNHSESIKTFGLPSETVSS